MQIAFLLAALVIGFAAGALIFRGPRLRKDYAAAREEAVALKAEKQALKEAQEHSRLQFEALASRIFEQNSAKFTEQSQKSLLEMLSPLKERFGEFQKKVDEVLVKEQFALKEEIKRIVEVNRKMTLQTESLTRALKGDVKAQGNWGEVMLEKILEASALRKGLDYLVQATGLDLKDADGAAQRPDVIVNLPEQKHVIIDSKVSLTHYERYCAEADDGVKAAALKSFLGSVRAHVVGLESRRYQDSDKLGSPDFVLMFMPVEGAYSLAVQQDQALHAYAWDKRVVLVCPTTLFATLQTIASMWKIELRNKKAEDIARIGGALYDKMAGFVSDMQDLSKHLGKAQASYETAMGKLSQGNGNVLRRMEQLKEYGAKTSKSLPRELLEEAEKLPLQEAS